MLGITFSQQSFQGHRGFFRTGDEASFVRVQSETSLSEVLAQGSVGIEGFGGHINGISSSHVKGDIIDPSLQKGRWVYFGHIPQRSVSTNLEMAGA